MNYTNYLRKLLFLLLGITFFHISYSQENYLPGYIINSRNDTLHGYIDYRNWGENPTVIHFKEKADGKVNRYTTLDIKGFYVQDEMYISAIVEKETSPIKINQLNQNPALNLKTDTIFLQTLFDGAKSLYYYRTANGKDNFYIKLDSVFELLIFKRYLKNQNDKISITENKKYIGQLSVYLSDCPNIRTKLKNTTYNLKSLEKLFQYYNEATESEVSFQKKKEKIVTEFGMLAGLSRSSIEFGGYDFPYLIGVDFGHSINPTYGLFFEIFPARNLRKLSISNELIYTSYNVKGYYEDIKNESYYSKISTELAFSYLKINTTIRFKYPIGKFNVFVYAGMSNGNVIHEKNYKKTVSQFYSTVSIDEGNALKPTSIRKYEQGLLLGLGIKYNKLSLETWHEKGSGMSKIAALSCVTSRYYVLLGYRF